MEGFSVEGENGSLEKWLLNYFKSFEKKDYMKGSDNKCKM